MALTSCAKFGPYEILSAFDGGEMREADGARDTRLNRTLAVKPELKIRVPK